MQATSPSMTSALPACSFLPVLRRNDNAAQPSSYVQDLQRRLNHYNFSLKVDGYFGEKTEAAVIEYQERINAHQPSFPVDGIVGPLTWNALAACVL